MNKKQLLSAFRNINGSVLIGIDGYVDEVWNLVQSRNEKKEAVLYTHMKQYADRIYNAAGGGMAVEIVRKRRSYGGFTANTGNAVTTLGIDTTMLCLFGADTIDSVFEPFEQSCKVISIGNPSLTHIFEFDDGKVMLPYEENTNKTSWHKLINDLGEDALTQLLVQSELVALGYWACMPDFDNIITEICQCLKHSSKTKRIFLDFADVGKKSIDSLKQVFPLLNKLNNSTPITLSMNEHEAAVVCSLYDIALNAKQAPEPTQIESLHKQIGIDEIVVHTPWYALAATTQEGVSIKKQNYCEKPVRTTGAGDTFNGGYISSIMAGLPIEDRLDFANRVVYYFLANGVAPELEDILNTLPTE